MKVSSVLIVGAGTMGAGIAQWFAQQMVPSTLCDNNQAQAAKALLSIHASWDKLVEKEKLTAFQVSQMKSLLEVRPLSAVTEAALVVEAIIENLEIKKQLFAQLDRQLSATAVIASNTSSFAITDLAQGVCASRRKNFLGLHFFNPATLMPLVEVIRGEETDSALAQELYQWFEAQGKKPALCSDSPGFIVNRVARNFYGEPLRIVESDDENKMREVDRLMREVGSFKMGPFELMDLIGIDVNYAVTCSVWEAFGKTARFAPHTLQKQMVDEKRLGKKTKRGYFRYE
jgi:3-hydroxybutyryl-CoA dehydrogenase